MNKNIFIGVFYALDITGVFAGQTESIQCPMKNEIGATQTETEEHSITQGGIPLC